MMERLKLVKAGGVSTCEYSMVHQDQDAVAWIEVTVCGVAQRYLACESCADLHAKRGLKTIIDVRVDRDPVKPYSDATVDSKHDHRPGMICYACTPNQVR